MLNYNKPYRVTTHGTYCDFATLFEAVDWARRAKGTESATIEHTITGERWVV